MSKQPKQSELAVLKKKIATIEKEWAPPEILAHLDETEPVCRKIVDLVVVKEVEDPLVFNALHNPKKNKNA